MQKLLTPKETAEILQISIKTLLGHVSAGKIVYIDLSLGKGNYRLLRFQEADVADFIASSRRRSSTISAMLARKSAGSLGQNHIVDFRATLDAFREEKKRARQKAVEKSRRD